MDSNPKIQKTEKAAVNIGVLELAQIDVLVENMLYTNRSDFIRTAIRRQLEYHRDYIGGLVSPNADRDDMTAVAAIGGIGVFRLAANDLHRLKAQGKKAKVVVIGVLIIDRSVDVTLFNTQVASIKVYGKLQAPKQLQEILEQKQMK